MKVESVTKPTPLPAGKGRFATDGTRHAYVTPTSLTTGGATFALERPTHKGENVELVDVAMAADGDVIWAIFSDTFAVAQGRFVARLTWSGTQAAWGPLKAPYPWSPYSHAGLVLEQIGAATVDTAFLTAYSDSSAVLARVGKHPHKGVPIARGKVGFGVAPPSLLTFANRKFEFYDAAGTVVASFGFSGAVKKAIGSPTAVWAVPIIGREVRVVMTGKIVALRLDEDPPALIAPTGKVKRPAPPKEATGLYGALDRSRSRSPMVIAIERVQSWDLNETPVFGKRAPLEAIILQPGAVQFCRVRDGKIRKAWDFMASAVTVSVAAPPKGTPKGIVLAQLRTPSGLTQLLCREEFAATLTVHTGRQKKSKR